MQEVVRRPLLVVAAVVLGHMRIMLFSSFPCTKSRTRRLILKSRLVCFVFLCFVFFFFSFPFFSLVYIRFYVHFSFLLRLSFIFQRRVFSQFLSRVKILDIRRFVCFRSNVIFLHIYLCYLVSVIVMKTHFLFLAFFLNHRYMTNIRNVNWQLICNTNNDIQFSIYTSNCLANTEII